MCVCYYLYVYRARCLSHDRWSSAMRQYALAQGAKRELLQRAKHDIVVTRQLYPNLGDAQRTKQYEDLLKVIQQRNVCFHLIQIRHI